MLTGHSQGGITAAALAADADFTREFNVTHVVTGGSPIATFDIPDDVHVLSLGHVQDPVPRLEGRQNPARATWLTVHRDVSDEVEDPMTAHQGRRYRVTGEAVDASDDPSLTQFVEGAAVFLTGDGQVRDYGVRRAP